MIQNTCCVYYLYSCFYISQRPFFIHITCFFIYIMFFFIYVTYVHLSMSFLICIYVFPPEDLQRTVVLCTKVVETATPFGKLSGPEMGKLKWVAERVSFSCQDPLNSANRYKLFVLPVIAYPFRGHWQIAKPGPSERAAKKGAQTTETARSKDKYTLSYHYYYIV